MIVLTGRDKKNSKNSRTYKQLDDATGLQHNLFRWYDSGLGQWLCEDPLGFAARDENLKRYVGGRLLSGTDPSGLVDPIDFDLLQSRIMLTSADQCTGSWDRPADFHENDERNLTILGYGILTVACMTIEPLDWAVTAYDIYHNPSDPWNYAGLFQRRLERLLRARSPCSRACDTLMM